VCGEETKIDATPAVSMARPEANAALFCPPQVRNCRL
jgi:hypothetical protein